MKSTSHGTVEPAHEVREEEHRSLEHSDQQQAAALVLGGDLLAELLDAVRQVVLLDEDLADRRVLHAGQELPTRRADSPIASGSPPAAANRSSSATPATHTICVRPTPPPAASAAARAGPCGR